MSKIIIKDCHLDGGPEVGVRLVIAEALKANAEACKALAISATPMINVESDPDLEPLLSVLREFAPKPKRKG